MTVHTTNLGVQLQQDFTKMRILKSNIKYKVYNFSIGTVSFNVIFWEQFKIFFLSQNLSLPKHSEISERKKGYVKLLQLRIKIIVGFNR